MNFYRKHKKKNILKYKMQSIFLMLLSEMNYISMKTLSVNCHCEYS